MKNYRKVTHVKRKPKRSIKKEVVLVAIIPRITIYDSIFKASKRIVA